MRPIARKGFGTGRKNRLGGDWKPLLNRIPTIKSKFCINGWGGEWGEMMPKKTRLTSKVIKYSK